MIIKPLDEQSDVFHNVDEVISLCVNFMYQLAKELELKF